MEHVYPAPAATGAATSADKRLADATAGPAVPAAATATVHRPAAVLGL